MSAELQAKVVPIFVEKLQAILEDSELNHLVSWSQDGESFGVHGYSEFSQTVLPKHFKHSNWQSFVRQLNMYGFSKISDALHLSMSSLEFRHPAFKRGRPDLYPSIKRRAASKNSPVSSHSPQPPSDSSLLERLSVKLEALERRVEWQADIISGLQDQLTASRQEHKKDQVKLESAIRALADLHEDEIAYKRRRRSRLENIDVALGQRSSSPPSNPKNTPSDSSPHSCPFRLPPISSLEKDFSDHFNRPQFM